MRPQNFKPALQTLNSLVGELDHSENPEDDEILSEMHNKNSSSASPNVTSYNGRSNGEESTRSQSMSPNSFFQRNGILEEFDNYSESEDDEGSLEERSETRTLTEVERLEEAQTALEDRVKQVKELLQRRDRTRKQRLQGQQMLARLEAKLEMLDQRLESERAGKNRWTFTKRVLRKPKVGFHSSELLNRKVPLHGLLANSLDTGPSMGEIVLQAMEQKSKEVQPEDNLPPKPKKIYKTKELQEFHVSLEDDAGGGTSKDGRRKTESGEELEENAINDGESDRKEIDKGWLRISDRPKDFIKRVDVSETHQSKEAWVNINEKGHQIFARKVFRSHLNGSDPALLSRSLDGRAASSNVRSRKFASDDRIASNISVSETRFDSNEKDKERRVRRISSSRTQRPPVVKMESIVGTTNFLPPIPKSEAKKRPNQEQVEKLKDENDEEQKKERMILIPNRKRVAKKRVEMYLKQLDFVKSHGLDQKEVLKNVGSAIQEHHDGEEEVPEHQAKTTPRNTLYLIGALSRNHLHPPTSAPPQ